MRSKDFSLFFLLFLIGYSVQAQYTLSGTVTDNDGRGIPKVEVFNSTLDALAITDADGTFQMQVPEKGTYDLIFFGYEYQVAKKQVTVNDNTSVSLQMDRLTTDLSEVTIREAKEKVFNLKRLNPVEGTAIFAGKKSEVVLMDNMVGNKAANNARQIYSQVVGLNIYDSGNAGLQLNVGGRGLDPNRTSNFNTRQNGYDISADVLGYPESYYTPPAEALREIQIIRGAASLQYGTQFGGLINFKMNSPVENKKFELVTRQSVGSFNLFSSFNSISGTIGDFSHYSYFQYKRGQGFRENSAFESINIFTNLNYQISDKTSVTVDLTHLDYLAEQPGGLTDTQFNQNPDFSNRERNWFDVNWNLAAIKLEHKFSEKTEASLMLFGLDARRNALGFRGNPSELNQNPVSAEDPQEDDEYIFPRDLIKGTFQNYGAEFRFLKRYQLGEKNAVFLIGSKFYKSSNTAKQGPGTNDTDPDFSFALDEYPNYPNRSSFVFPNENIAIFGEHIFFLSDKWSITPGFRVEKIKTESEGTYNNVTFDNAGNAIENTTLEDNRTFDRSFMLLGVGTSYDFSDKTQIYANFSENYRSVTFTDIRTVNPSFVIDPSISDESGYTADLGVRGRWDDLVSYDIGGFGMLYNKRIGTVLNDRAERVRRNIGKAFIYGLEVFSDINILEAFAVDSHNKKVNLFINTAITGSEYVDSDINNVQGRKVEFIPTFNLKTGINFGINNLLGNVQWTYMGEQYTDAENSAVPEASDNRNGIIGEIPAYHVLDVSLSWRWRKFQFESGMNNVLNNSYFTRRATGYPGPGIIPADPRTVYFTLQYKI